MKDVRREKLEGEIETAHQTLIEDYQDFEGLRRITDAGWERLQIHIGLGLRLSRSVRDFDRQVKG